MDAPSRRIITGSFHPELEEALLADLEARAAADPLAEIPVVVPTNLLRLRLSRELAGRAGGHANVRFVTLKDLAATLAPPPLSGERAPLPRGADLILVRRLLADGVARGGYFEAIDDRPGLARALLETIRDLKEARFTPDSFAEAARVAGLSLARRGKVAGLSRVFQEYERLLAAERWADTADVMAEAARRASSDRPELLLYGFYDLNALQKHLVASYASDPCATVYFPYVAVDAFRYAAATLDWFLESGFARTDLGGDARPVPLPREVHMVSSPGEAREAREDVRRLVAILREREASGGERGDETAFQDAAVLLRTTGDYGQLFADELANVTPNPYLDAPPPILRQRAARAFFKLAEIVRSEFGRTEVIEFLSLADLASVDDGELPVASWNRAAMAAGITRGADAWTAKLDSLVERLDRARSDRPLDADVAELRGAAASLSPLIDSLVRPLASLPGRATIRGFVDALGAVYTDLTRPGEERRAFLERLEALAALSPVAGVIGFEYFVELVRRHLDEPAERAARFGVGGPSVLNLMAARGLRFPVVILPGLVEKRFPMPRRQDPILLDAERLRLNGACGEDPLRRLPTSETGAEEELLFRLAVSSASEVLIESFPRLDPATGRPRVPSFFVLDTLSALDGRDCDYEDLEASPRVDRVPLSRRFPESRRTALTREEFDGCSVLAALSSGDAGEIAYLVNAEGPLSRGLAMEETRWSRAGFTEYDGVARSKESRAAIEALTGIGRGGTAAGAAVSATALEEYARCPFRFFMHHVLHIAPPEEPEEAFELSPRDRGRLYHTVLERFLRGACRDGRLPLSLNELETLRKTAADVALGGWSVAGFRGARELEVAGLSLNLAFWLFSEVREGSAYVPAYFESSFGLEDERSEDAATAARLDVVAAGDVALAFRGRIDRIDVDGKRGLARVIDYKTGAAERRKKAKEGEQAPLLDAGRRLQLPIYVLAARAMLDAAGSSTTVESAEYRYVRTHGPTTSLCVGAEEIDERAGDLRTALGLIVKGIAEGMFFPYPEDQNCKHCDYREACGVTALALASMKYGDPRAGFFTEGLQKIK